MRFHRFKRLLAGNRRGSALMLVLVFTVALGGLAISAIYMSGSTQILSKLYDRERDYRYAAEWALALGKARVVKDTTLVLPDSGYVTLINGGSVTAATGATLPRVRVDMYAGLSGAVNGQWGRAISLVAAAYDAGGARHVRRLELSAENFARFAVFVDQWSGSPCYTTGEIVRGRAHSNQNWVSCGSSPGPVYTDSVSAVNTISGTAQYQVASVAGVARIPYPTVPKLAALPTLAANANLSFNARPYSTGGTRMEFVAIDVDGDSAITGAAEGYFRLFDPTFASAADTVRTRASFASPMPNSGNVVVRRQCGVFYTLNGRPGFVPVAAHYNPGGADSTWIADSLVAQGWTAVNAIARAKAADTTIMKLAGARCYPAGDPHLMPIERKANPTAVLAASNRRGGEDSTFTAGTYVGAWRAFPGANPGVIVNGTSNRQSVEEPYLWPIHRSLNPNSQGVVYVNGDIWLSGVVRGRVTLYSSGAVKFIDDLTYATHPASLPVCQNLLGILTGTDVWLSDNSINRPRRVGGAATARFLDDNQDFELHGVTLSGVTSATGSFRTENFGSGPNAGRLCTISGSNVQTSGGCINQVGGVIQRVISATFSGGWTGFAENRAKDACLDFDSPPYYPLTGRYYDNEFYELDPAQFNVTNLFRSLQASGP